jgi:hypothetical protein
VSNLTVLLMYKLFRAAVNNKLTIAFCLNRLSLFQYTNSSLQFIYGFEIAFNRTGLHLGYFIRPMAKPIISQQILSLFIFCLPILLIHLSQFTTHAVRTLNPLRRLVAAVIDFPIVTSGAFNGLQAGIA